MGTVKFYNGGQSVTESMIFSLYDIVTMRSNYTLSTYPTKTYTDKELTTESTTAKLIPLVKVDESSFNFQQKRFGIPYQNSNNIYGAMFGSSNTVHNKTLDTFNNVVASIDNLSEATYNGVKTMVLSATNLDSENSTTICSIQRSNKYQFVNNLLALQAGNHFYLDWAYYFDQDEYITLEPGETKTVVINFTLSDITA